MEPCVTVNGCAIMGKTLAASHEVPRPVDVFYGIPFAQAERFRASQLLDPSPGMSLRASAPGPSAPFPTAPHNTAESPLTLNVFRPGGRSSSDEEKKMPVVVYIHGGGFNFGHPLERHLASMLGWAQEDIMFVAVGYRLGPLGFMAGEDQQDEPRNLGLGDQRTAVEWVRKWIGPFGGDADALTLMGISAGAHSIGHHMLHPSPLPFRKAILESGSATARSTLSAAHPRVASQLRQLLAQCHGIPLSSIPVDMLLDAALSVFAQQVPSVSWPFQPVVDNRPGSLLPDTPLNMWADMLSRRGGAAAAGMSVITGFCSHEGSSFIRGKASTNEDFRAFFAALIPAMTAADLDALEALYPDPVTDSTSPYSNVGFGPPQQRRLYEAYGHYAYICPILHTAHLLSRAGARVYVYEYAAVSSPLRTAGHGDHAPVLSHGMVGLRYRPGLAAVADEMGRRWASFAAAEDGDLRGGWPAFQSPLAGGDGTLLVFGEGNDEAAGGRNPGVPVRERRLTERELEQCRFWWDRMELSEGMGERGSSRLSW
ncbi:Alpha/Beta hydrolase protein [Stachybotrys elegans]|uniref:Carboxylic ester hydrolase n=1 Tax=Stachybotrys elegans TaxID=80388 RepID=A0A8K0SVF3_9HYPO|nr:Alpha/Beta hydrolase protein [Stachybotrys elegans]